MDLLLVAPRVPTTYWSFDYSLPFVAKGAAMPPLGLITLAACLPRHWRIELVDCNLGPLEDRAIRRADAVLVGGMLVQTDAIRAVLERARALGRPTVVGGPAASASPELFTAADVVFQGEAEGREDELVAAITGLGATRGPLILSPAPGTHPDLAASPTPRFDLLEVDRYATMSLQYSRGCPFSCEFCDVVELFGRRSRVKRTEQVLAELDALLTTGYRGGLFVVDDNFVGNRASVRRLLPELAAWQHRHRSPFNLFTEVSADLARDPELVESMVAAGFGSVFVGLETPSRAALREAGKRQNLATPPARTVAALTRAGLEVMGGFIVGFDSDGPEIFAAQLELIEPSPIPFAMVGLLSALPGTALWQRLAAEGRLRGRPRGDQFECPNFEPAMGERRLLRGYHALLERLYSAPAYYRRCRAQVALAGAGAGRSRGANTDLAALAKALLRIGLLGPRRRHFWRLLACGLGRGLPGLRRAIELAIKGEHMIRYTAEHVLPRIEAALRATDGVSPALARPA